MSYSVRNADCSASHTRGKRDDCDRYRYRYRRQVQVLVGPGLDGTCLVLSVCLSVNLLRAVASGIGLAL